ncbi:unnamed protein product [Hydatigera taeniaeformis]|uniref:Uncharacterized protein n=1 Tax=Hydatigena taeniaeformis TaxID=6205 RepID=A0A0R3WTE5_HYDTA|nr:unnamed protein product [Hydatigera taeniaeformis]
MCQWEPKNTKPTSTHKMPIRIGDWLQRRQNPLSVYHLSSTTPAPTAAVAAAASVTASTGCEALSSTPTVAALTSQSAKANELPASNLATFPVKESTGRRTTLAPPMAQRNLFRSSSLSVNRGK